MKFSILSLCFALLCPFPASASELGAAGNEEAASLFDSYRNAPVVCDGSLPGRRVLLTGFGLFQSVALNSAGAVVSNIANTELWPESVSRNEVVELRRGVELSSGKFLTKQGAKAFQRALELNGEKINLCVLVLDVLWDSAGAIVALEMNRFQPEKVLMLGGGGGPILEGGALNYAEAIPGYYADGREDALNLPQARPILPLEERFHELPMRWNNNAIRSAVSALLEKTGLTLETAPGARPGNTYLCNHVSYVALATAAGIPVELAGGRIRLESRLATNPKVGFFHLPWDLPLTRKTIRDWGSLVLAVIDNM